MILLTAAWPSRAAATTRNEPEPTRAPAQHTQQAAPSPTAFAPRFDGLYGGRIGLDDRTYVRFFPNGTVLEVSTTGDATPDDVRKWLRLGDPHTNGNGPWKYDTKGAFTTHLSDRDVHFTVRDFRGTGFDPHPASIITRFSGTLHMVFYAD